VGFFTKPLVEDVEMAPRANPEQLRYEEVLAEMAAAKRETAGDFHAILAHTAIHPDNRLAVINGEVQRAVGAMTRDSELQRLEARHRQSAQKYSDLLAEHARLKKVLGLASY